MKKIKFRAWANDHWTDFIPVAKTLGIYNESVIDVGGYTYEKENPFIVEQYTGLKDKNGKEIYEGDIMAQTLIDDPFTKKYPTYVVCWDEEFLSWALKDISGDDGNDTDLQFFIEEWKKCEVIGNIHENPELLKGE